MRFSIVATLAALGSVALGQATVSSAVVVQSINTLTIKTQNLIEPANQLTVLNAPLLIIGQGPWPVRLPKP
jgi:LPS O-antigen subunit length determinant protein (WzzB/FepE family)